MNRDERIRAIMGEIITPEPPAVGLQCRECLEPDEDPLPWCDCARGEECAGPCRRRAHEAGKCADRKALADRRATGCQYNSGLCACPSAPYKYEGCRAK